MIPPDAKNAVGKPIPQKKTETKAATSTAKPADNTKKTTTAVTAKPVAKEGESLYVVKSGDSLSVIAQRHHVKLADLVAANTPTTSSTKTPHPVALTGGQSQAGRTLSLP